ncbi:Protein C30H6.8 [Aphelenchoides avenae]|nr:Protein C30H6.8 [Aphelenchus avenae]
MPPLARLSLLTSLRHYSSSKHFLENVVVKSRKGNVDLNELEKKEFYEKTKDDGVEVLWISRDKTAEDQQAYYEKSLPPWLYVEYGEQIKQFNEFYDAKTIPALKLVNPEGEVVDDGARVKVESALHADDGPKKLVDEWKKALGI